MIWEHQRVCVMLLHNISNNPMYQEATQQHLTTTIVINHDFQGVLIKITGPCTCLIIYDIKEIMLIAIKYT